MQKQSARFSDNGENTWIPPLITLINDENSLKNRFGFMSISLGPFVKHLNCTSYQTYLIGEDRTRRSSEIAGLGDIIFLSFLFWLFFFFAYQFVSLSQSLSLCPRLPPALFRFRLEWWTTLLWISCCHLIGLIGESRRCPIAIQLSD